ncbi:cyclic di-GMP phosphodiesterase, partial [Achromobacter xylosoxidans]
MTDDQDEKSILYTHFGTHSPYWRLSADSDAFELAAVKGAANIAMALRPEQAETIRSLTGITSSVRIDISLYGDMLRL